MRTITRNVINYRDIPEEITSDDSVLNEVCCDCYISYKINIDNPNKLDKWFMENYPELIGFEFLIEIDY